MDLRRGAQVIGLLAFLSLLAGAIIGPSTIKSAEFFLRLDPGLMGLTAAAARTLSWAFMPAALVLLVGPIAGRLFCGYLCPMGTTLDGGDMLLAAAGRQPPVRQGLNRIKYLLLTFLTGAALLSVSWVFWAAPLSLITRLYGLVIYPLLALIADETITAFLPLAEKLDWSTLVYTQIKTPRFSTGLFVLFLFLAIFSLARLSPRFWCRYLCPSGALIALTSIRPLIRRQVSDECFDCGQCARSCPMGAISEADPRLTLHQECIVCRTCEKTCPVSAVAFTFQKQGGRDPDINNPVDQAHFPGRRKFLTAGLTGAAAAAVSLTALPSPFSRKSEGLVQPAWLIRPPGSRPERSFLARCVRCGECVAACPTNTLQPLWLKAGLNGLFSPALTPKRGYCDPHCRTCGQVCPTGAITPLTKFERLWAKTGTAVIFRQACLAWEQQKPCMVCDEVCPFDAIEFKKEPHNPVAIPHVIENKCAGCGYCEHYCPVHNLAAIRVKPMGALRLESGSYQKEARRLGLDLSLKPIRPSPGFSEPAPGFSEPAPGFSEPAPDRPVHELAPGFSK